MNRKYIIYLVVGAIIVVVVTASCLTLSLPSSSSEDPASITIVDQRGKTLTIPQPCTRVVFLVENAMNTMLAVGGADTIVGVGGSNYGEVKEAFFNAIFINWSSMARMSWNSGQLSLETLAAVNPQLVVLWSASLNDTNTVAIEENLHIPVYGAYIDDLADVSKQIEDFAKIIGKENSADELKEIMNAEIKKVTDVTYTIPESEKPTVFWMWTDIYGTAGIQSTANDLINLAGGVNVIENWDNTSKNMEHPVLSMESIAVLDPDVIIMWYNTKVDPSDIMTGADYSAWQSLRAVQNGRVYEIESPFVYDFHCPRLPLAMLNIAKYLYPDEFIDVNMAEEVDDYFVSVYGVHYPGFEKV